jgi:uncharacterized radical SAM superfamily Fe-S cluster-containing enzyme
LCERHLQSTCCVLVEVTPRCDLRCPVCFANSGGAGLGERERTVAEWYDVFRKLVDDGRTFLQLSGGEPTVRDDLPEIVAAAVRAGCENVQLNSNGVRLGRDPEFTRKLADSGLSFVFMQFDGVTDDAYVTLRGRALLREKLDAIEQCDRANLGVTLVPTVVPGVNDGQLGEILKFGFNRSPAVRGVHFQPISYFGRYPSKPRDSERITLPEIIAGLEAQTHGLVKRGDFSHSTCDHPRCGFHGDFVVMPDRIVALTRRESVSESCCSPKNGAISDEALRNRKFVSRRWKRESLDASGHAEVSGDGFDAFLHAVKRNGFTVTGMAFQDRMTLEVERLRRCSLHVCEPDSGRIVPFCAYYNGLARQQSQA